MSAIYASLEKSTYPKQDCDEELVDLAKSVFAQARADQGELNKKSTILVGKLLKPKFEMCTGRIGHV
jgi:hypothetical protein